MVSNDGRKIKLARQHAAAMLQLRLRQDSETATELLNDDDFDAGQVIAQLCYLFELTVVSLDGDPAEVVANLFRALAATDDMPEG